MDQKGILEILRFVNKSTLHEVEIEENEFKLRIRKGSEENIIYSNVPVAQPVQQVAAPAVMPAQVAPTSAPEAPASQKEEAPAAEAEEAENKDLFTFKSPMIGTFYRSPSPDKEAYIKVGDIVSRGQVMCIVEAMKLFNEIEYEGEKEGKVVKILVENATPVEYDTPLFLIDFS